MFGYFVCFLKSTLQINEFPQLIIQTTATSSLGVNTRPTPGLIN